MITCIKKLFNRKPVRTVEWIFARTVTEYPRSGMTIAEKLYDMEIKGVISARQMHEALKEYTEYTKGRTLQNTLKRKGEPNSPLDCQLLLLDWANRP